MVLRWGCQRMVCCPVGGQPGRPPHTASNSPRGRRAVDVIQRSRHGRARKRGRLGDKVAEPPHPGPRPRSPRRGPRRCPARRSAPSPARRMPGGGCGRGRNPTSSGSRCLVGGSRSWSRASSSPLPGERGGLRVGFDGPHERRAPALLARAPQRRRPTAPDAAAAEAVGCGPGRAPTLRAEYEAWRDQLRESLADSRTAGRLKGVYDVDLDALDVELPGGFGTQRLPLDLESPVAGPRDTRGRPRPSSRSSSRVTGNYAGNYAVREGRTPGLPRARPRAPAGDRGTGASTARGRPRRGRPPPWRRDGTQPAVPSTPGNRVSLAVRRRAPPPSNSSVARSRRSPAEPAPAAGRRRSCGVDATGVAGHDQAATGPRHSEEAVVWRK